MVISHDRWFLDRIATHILDYQDEGKVEFFEGNFTEYEEYKLSLIHISHCPEKAADPGDLPAS